MFAEEVGRALRRAARAARRTGRVHGTSIYVWREGNVVAEKPSGAAGPPPRRHVAFRAPHVNLGGFDFHLQDAVRIRAVLRTRVSAREAGHELDRPTVELASLKREHDLADSRPDPARSARCGRAGWQGRHGAPSQHGVRQAPVAVGDGRGGYVEDYRSMAGAVGRLTPVPRL